MKETQEKTLKEKGFVSLKQNLTSKNNHCTEMYVL